MESKLHQHDVAYGCVRCLTELQWNLKSCLWRGELMASLLHSNRNITPEVRDKSIEVNSAKTPGRVLVWRTWCGWMLQRDQHQPDKQFGDLGISYLGSWCFERKDAGTKYQRSTANLEQIRPWSAEDKWKQCQFLAHSRNILCKSLSLEMARSFESVESGKSCHSSLDINMNSISLSLAPASADQSCSSDAGKTHPQRRRVGLDKDSPSLISHSFLQWHGITKLSPF